MAYRSIADQVRRHTRAAFGTALNPHCFRDCAATFIAIVDPEHVWIVAAILGHSTLATSERHYNQARGLEASRRYHGTLAALRTRASEATENPHRLDRRDREHAEALRGDGEPDEGAVSKFGKGGCGGVQPPTVDAPGGSLGADRGFNSVLSATLGARAALVRQSALRELAQT
jgi:hypothetical protein